MPVTINGTTGIAGPDGSASTPAVQGTDSNTGLFFPAADTVAITTGGTQRVTVDSSGNVGIGLGGSSPGAKLDVAGSTYIRGDSSSATFTSPGQLAIKRSTDSPFVSLHQNDGTRIGFLQMQGAGLCSLWVEVNQDLRFATSNTERVRITSGGVLDLATGAGAVGQIQFPATQVASSNANTLDDYEEGTWTPTITPATSGTITLVSPNACGYTKIGRVVTITGLMDTASVSSPVGATITINNLPFTSNATATQRSAGVARCFSLTSGSLNTTIVITSSVTTMTVYVDASLFQTGSQIYFQLSYTV